MCQLIGINDLESWRSTHGGWSGLLTLEPQRKSLCLPMDLPLNCEKICLKSMKHSSRSSSNKKKIGSTPHLCRQVSQLLTVSILLLKKGYRVHAKVFKILWVYLWDYRKDMKKWDEKSTSTLEAWACELQGKTITNVDSSGKIAAPVSSRQFPRHSGMANLTSDSMVNSVVEF